MIVAQVKQPAETLKVVPAFQPGARLVELVDVTVEARGLVVGSEMLAYHGEIADGAASIEVSGGTDGERYLVTVHVTDDQSQVREGEIEIAVIDGQWQLPDGGVPYLTIVRFVERVGLDEVVRLTDLDGSGRVNRGLVIGALSDAQAEADAHLASRYAIPLEVVPPIIEMAITARARAALYRNGAPEGIATAAKEALRTLERIQSGQMPLGVPGAVAPAADSDAPVLIAPGVRAYPDLLQDY